MSNNAQNEEVFRITSGDDDVELGLHNAVVQNAYRWERLKDGKTISQVSVDFFLPELGVVVKNTWVWWLDCRSLWVKNLTNILDEIVDGKFVLSSLFGRKCVIEISHDGKYRSICVLSKNEVVQTPGSGPEQEPEHEEPEPEPPVVSRRRVLEPEDA